MLGPQCFHLLRYSVDRRDSALLASQVAGELVGINRFSYRAPGAMEVLSPFFPQVPCGLAGLGPFSSQIPCGLVGLSHFSPQCAPGAERTGK